MAGIPSSALAGAAVAADALAGVVAGLAGVLPVASTVAAEVPTTCRRIQLVAAPRVRTASDVGAIGEQLVGAVQAVARAADAGDASAALYAAGDAAAGCYPRSASPVLTSQFRLARALATAIQVACLTEAWLAEARTGFGDRRAAGEARARVSDSFDAVSDAVSQLLGPEVVAAVGTASRQCSVHLVEQAASLRPIIQVDAPRSYPSTAIAWSLYGDPARCAELVARNRCGTSLFMPASIEALSPSA